MSGLDPLYLALAGFGAGLTGSIAGLASLVSYPALLALGLPAVNANVTNTVALVFSTVGSVLGSRPELDGQRPRLVRLGVVAVAGGAIGGLVLLLTPSSWFARVVPVLIGAASLGVLARRAPGQFAGERDHARARNLAVMIFLIGIYCGYFGAAAGMVMLSALLWSTGEVLARANAAKNVLLGCANVVAAVAFAIFGPVHWSFVAPLALGCLIGGRLGPVIVRHAPTGPLRLAIALGGIGLAVHLGLDAYA